MPNATRLAVRLSFAALLCAGTALAASKPAPQVTPIDPVPGITALSTSPGHVNSTCTLGVPTAPAYLVDYIYPPNDQYYTFIDPASCTECAGGPVSALVAHVLLNFRAVCAQPVSVGIYGASGDVSCYMPDPSVVLCPPFNVNLSPGATGNYDFSIPIPAGCCISQPAFLKIEFVALAQGCGTSTTVPRLITTADCSAPCASWNLYPGGGPDDLCYSIGFPGQPIMNLEVDCCSATPNLKHSWGSLKSSYR